MPKINFQATGTEWSIEVRDNFDRSRLKNLLKGLVGIVVNFEEKYSRFIDSSMTTSISKSVGRHFIDDNDEILFSFYIKLHELTDGKFTPLIGELLSQAGYDKDYSFTQKNQLVTLPSMIEVLEMKKPWLNIIKTSVLDFGAAGKGHLVDLVATYLEKEELHNFTIDAGGDILHRTSVDENISIGLEHPLDSTMVVGKTFLKNSSICGSSGNRRKWQDFHHIINPHNLTSPREIISTWVTAKNTREADGLATALFVTSPASLQEHFDFEYLILNSDFSITSSSGFSAELY